MRWLFEKNLLENKIRAAIFKYISENPQTYPQKIMHEVNIGRGTVLYHLDILLYAGLVSCLKDGKFKRYSAVKHTGIGGEKLNSKATM